MAWLKRLVRRISVIQVGVRRVPGATWMQYEPTGRLYWTKLRIPVTRAFVDRLDGWTRA